MSPLKIIPASAPITVNTICLVIYGTPGVGKTTLGFSADNPLVLDCDKGAHRSGFRKDVVRPDSWSEIAGIAKADVQNYKTLVLDTAGRALDLLALEIMEKNPKLGRGGALTLQGFGELKGKFIPYLNLVRSFGLDVVLVAHSDEKQQGDEIIERIDAQGGSKNEIYKSADAMGRLGYTGNRRVLSFSPGDTRFGKDPAGLGTVIVPDFAPDGPQFLASVIRDIKAALNRESAAQTEATKAAQAFATALAAAETPEAFTALIKSLNGDKVLGGKVNEAATAKRFVYDNKIKAYVDPSVPTKVAADDDGLPY